MSMEPGPEAQDAFMKADLWFLENVVKRAHHWAPIVAGFFLLLHFIKPLDIVFQAMIMSAYVWVALNSDERTAALRWLGRKFAALRSRFALAPATRAIDTTAARALGLLGHPTVTPPKKAINVLGAVLRVIGFVWKYRKLILIGLVLAFLFLGVGPLMRACTTLPFGIGESREELRAERDEAIDRSRVVTKISRSAIRTGEEYRTVRETIIREVEVAREQIQDHPHEDALGLLTVWRDADRRLCDLALASG